MTFILRIFELLWAVVDAVRRFLFGGSRQRYVSRVFIAGTPQEVWEIFEARTVIFDGWMPVRIDSNPRDDGSGIVDSTITVGDQPLKMAYRIVEWHHAKAALLEILKDQTDPSLYHGDDYYLAMGVEPADGGCFLTLSHELTHTNFGGRISLATGVAAGGRRVKRLVESRNGRAQKKPAQVDWNNVGTGIMTGILTFASFALLFDWQFAALLIAVVLVHEIGHVIAMRWCGMPVRGIYFMPFLGAVAVANTGWRNEAERGLVALMGPGFSVLPTAMLFYFFDPNTSDTVYYLIVISAFLNALNLVPVLPLDGGHVFGALTSNMDDDVRHIIESVFLLIGIAAAVYFKMWLLAGFGVMYLFSVWNAEERQMDAPINGHDGLWLLLAYVGTIVFYVSVWVSVTA